MVVAPPTSIGQNPPILFGVPVSPVPVLAAKMWSFPQALPGLAQAFEDPSAPVRREC